MTEPIRVLFVCTGNSARSALSEATLNARGAGRFVAYSAGSRPTGRIHPQALATLAAHGIPADGLRSKSWDEFSRPDAPRLDVVVTVCDSAAGESCPVLFGDFVRTHWGLPDPPAAEGGDAAVAAAFDAAQRVVEHRIAQLVAMPDAVLRGPDAKAALDAIGRSWS